MAIDILTLALAKKMSGSGGGITDEQVNSAVNAWLNEHPEATTTVQDGTVTTEKLADGAVTNDKLSNDIQYVTSKINKEGITWEIGKRLTYVNDGNAGKEMADPWCALSSMSYFEAGDRFTVTGSLKWRGAYYGLDGSVCDYENSKLSAWQTSSYTMPLDGYYRFYVSYSPTSSTVLTEENFATLSERFTLKSGHIRGLNGEVLEDSSVGMRKLGKDICKSFLSNENLYGEQKIRTLTIDTNTGSVPFKKVNNGYAFSNAYRGKSCKTPSVDSAGKFPATVEGGTLSGVISDSDICVVGDELWVFSASSDDNLTYGTCWRFKYDPVVNELVEDPKFFWHNWGHVNSINYNSEEDSLIMGNGGADYTLANKIHIIPNASAIKNMENGAIVSLDEYGVVIDVSDQEAFGKKLNVFWAKAYGVVCKANGWISCENLAYAYSDDMNKFHMLAFGFDTFQHANGNYVEPSGNNRWNGTYTVLKNYQIGDENENIGNPGSYTHCGQGGAAICGKAFVGKGHSSHWYSELTINGDTVDEKETNIVNYNAETGLVGNWKMLGLDVTNRYLIIAKAGISTNPTIHFIPR